MPKCDYCDLEFARLYQCYYCKFYFCEEHLLSKNHECARAPKVSSRTVLLLSPIMILVGMLILYVSLLPSVEPPRGSLEWAFGYGWIPGLGAALIVGGIIGPIVRNWQDQRVRRNGP